MSQFNEFNQQGSVPTKETGSIIGHAFEMYKGVFMYALLAMVLYIAASWSIELISGFDSQAFMEEIKNANGKQIKYWEIEGFITYSVLSWILGLLVAPFFVGLIYMANKCNSRKQLAFSDLFIGFKQNFLNIVIYSIITSLLVTIAFLMCILPGFLVAPFFLLGYPILLFENASAIDAMKKSFSIAKENYGTFLGTTLLGGLISFSGLLLCCIGVIATIPFMYVVTYSAYCAFAGKPREIVYYN